MKKNDMIVIVVAMLCLMSLGIAFCFLGLNNSIEKKCLEYVENSVESVDKRCSNCGEIVK